MAAHVDVYPANKVFNKQNLDTQLATAKLLLAIHSACNSEKRRRFYFHSAPRSTSQACAAADLQ